MKHVLLGLLIGLILGVGIGSALLSPDPVGKEIALVTPVVKPPSEDRVIATELPTVRTETAREEAPRTLTSASPKISEARVSAAISAIPTPKIEREEGLGIISGLVLDQEGRGVSNVMVQAARERDRGSRLSDPSEVGVSHRRHSLESTLRRSAKDYAAKRAHLFEATSNASGEFSLRGLVDGNYSLIADCDGYLIHEKGGPSNRLQARTGDEVELLATPIVEVPVSVQLAGGAQVERAIVRCSDRSLTSDEDWSQDLFGYGNNEFTWSPAAPNLRLPAGTVHLKAFANPGASQKLKDANKANFRSEPVEIELFAGETPAPVSLVLGGRSGIRGRVIYPAERLNDVRPEVHLMPIPNGSKLDLAALSDSDTEESLWQGQTEFSFLDLTEGRYAVGITRLWGGPIEVYEVLDVGVGVTECELELPPVNLDKYLLVTVLGPDGERAKEVRFGFTHKSGRGSSSRSGGTPPSTQDGLYVYTIPKNSRKAYYEEPDTDDEFFLKLRVDGFGALEIPLTPGQSEVTAHLLGEATLEVVVAGFSGSGLEGELNVSLSIQRSDGESPYSGSTDQESVSLAGVAKFTELAAQAYRVTLRSDWRHGETGSWTQGYNLASVDAFLETGDNKITLQMPPLYALDVLTVDSEGDSGDWQVSLAGFSTEGALEIRNSISRRIPDQEGRVTFDLLPAGEYCISADKVTEQVVTVPCGMVTLKRE